MLKLLFKKWWVILLQGILLIILSIFIFSYPDEVLKGISFWFGIIVLITGLIGIFAWISANKEEREDLSLLWSILNLAFGILMVFNLLIAGKILTIIFGLWSLASGMLLVKYGWSLKSKSSMGWVILITGILCIIAAIMIIFNIESGAIAISIILGLQVLIAGIAMVLLSIAKKMIGTKVKDIVETLK